MLLENRLKWENPFPFPLSFSPPSLGPTSPLWRPIWRALPFSRDPLAPSPLLGWLVDSWPSSASWRSPAKPPRTRRTSPILGRPRGARPSRPSAHPSPCSRTQRAGSFNSRRRPWWAPPVSPNRPLSFYPDARSFPLPLPPRPRRSAPPSTPSACTAFAPSVVSPDSSSSSLPRPLLPPPLLARPGAVHGSARQRAAVAPPGAFARPGAAPPCASPSCPSLAPRPTAPWRARPHPASPCSLAARPRWHGVATASRRGPLPPLACAREPAPARRRAARRGRSSAMALGLQPWRPAQSPPPHGAARGLSSPGRPAQRALPQLGPCARGLLVSAARRGPQRGTLVWWNRPNYSNLSA
jgi:hypothetical protein